MLTYSYLRPGNVALRDVPMCEITVSAASGMASGRWYDRRRPSNVVNTTCNNTGCHYTVYHNHNCWLMKCDLGFSGNLVLMVMLAVGIHWTRSTNESSSSCIFMHDTIFLMLWRTSCQKLYEGSASLTHHTPWVARTSVAMVLTLMMINGFSSFTGKRENFYTLHHLSIVIWEMMKMQIHFYVS